MNVLQAIQYVADSWKVLIIRTIQNCFARYGLLSAETDNVPAEEEKEDVTIIIQDVKNFYEFLSVDDELPCYDINKNCEVKDH